MIRSNVFAARLVKTSRRFAWRDGSRLAGEGNRREVGEPGERACLGTTVS